MLEKNGKKRGNVFLCSDFKVRREMSYMKMMTKTRVSTRKKRRRRKKLIKKEKPEDNTRMKSNDDKEREKIKKSVIIRKIKRSNSAGKMREKRKTILMIL